MIEDLIYDVGLHNGDDTAYYLKRGFRVIGIEANPAMAGIVAERFAAAIRDGRLTILNVAIAASAGRLPFWVSESNTVWSSFDRSVAGRDGRPVRQIQVECRTFASVLAEFGVPYFLKIDIEGNDHLCIEALTAPDLPRYLSVEGSPDTIALLDHLHDLGFTEFKCITQSHFLPLQITPVAEQRSMERIAGTGGARQPLFGTLRRRLAGAWGRRYLRHTGNWRFAEGSSGAFGEDTLGEWQSLAEMKATLDYFDNPGNRRESYGAVEQGSWSFWFDFHCRRPDNA